MRNELHKEKHTNIVEASNEKRAPQRKTTQTLVEPIRNELHKEKNPQKKQNKEEEITLSFFTSSVLLLAMRSIYV